MKKENTWCTELYPKRVRKVTGKDYLSNLPDDILIHIQSFLDVRSAAKTCVLSKRWNKKLWMHHQDLYLNSKTFGKTSNKFRKFVEMVLTQRDKLHLKIRAFSFTWSFVSKIPKHLLDKVHAHAQDHDVRKFNLSICWDSRHDSFLSQNFNPKYLITLRLKLNCCRGSDCTVVRHHILQLYLSRCTALKTLCLEKIGVQISGGDVNLFSGLVDLTELHIIGCHIVGKDRCFLIGAPKLERLTILNNIYGTHWDISSSVLKYLRTDLKLLKRTINQLPSFIEELEINFQSLGKYETAYHAEWLINQIRCLPHAKSVTLSMSALQVLSAFPQIFDSKVPVTVSQFKWEFLKVITTNELPTNEFPEYRPGLDALTKNCSDTLKVEFV